MDNNKKLQMTILKVKDGRCVYLFYGILSRHIQNYNKDIGEGED